MTTLEQELKHVKAYLEIEETRFFNKLIVEYNVDDKVLLEHIPPLTLQPIVENAVKHGITSVKENGSIQIEFRKIKADLRLSITDNGKGFDSGKEYNGLGLQL